MALYQRHISEAFARGSATDHVTARLLALWLLHHVQQEPDYMSGLIHFARTGGITRDLRGHLRQHARSPTLSRSETRPRAVSWGFAAGSGDGWDHLGMLLSIVYRLVRCLFGLLAVLARSNLSKDAELLVLRHENQVLRRQLTGRLRWDHVDRVWLAALSWLVRRRRWPEVFPVTRPRSCDGTVTSSPASGTTPAGAGQDDRPPGPRSRR